MRKMYDFVWYKMAHRFFIILLILCKIGDGKLLAQDKTPFAVKPQKVLTLSAKKQALLPSKTWTTFKQYLVNQGKATLHLRNYVAFKFLPDGKLQAIVGTNGLSGTWKVTGKRTLQIVINSQSDSDTIGIGGNYNVYKITEQELVMEKERTADESIIHYFKAGITSVLTESPQKGLTHQPIAENKKAVDTSRQQASIISEIETEAQLRGIKIKEKLTKMDVKSLQLLKNQVVQGVYQKEKIKS